VKRLGAAFLTLLGGTPSRNNPAFWRNGTIPWINSGKVNDHRVTEPSELITELALEKSAAKLMPPGTTLIAITGATLGQVSMLEIQATANQSVVGVISKDENLIEWLHLTISERIQSIINHASGGAQQHINKGIVDDVVVAVPPSNITKDFQSIALPLYRQIACLIFKNTTLRRTRDLLLPRLISGEVDVSALDIALPEEASA
jgi:type I restriction enzyme S subunit